MRHAHLAQDSEEPALDRKRQNLFVDRFRFYGARPFDLKALRGCLLVQILLKPYKYLSNLLRLAKVGDGVSYRVVIFQP